MKTTIVAIIAATMMLTACGDEGAIPGDNLKGDPPSISRPIVAGRYGLMNIKATDSAGVIKDMSFIGLLRFEYQLVGTSPTADTFRETIFGTVTMGQDKLDCGSIQHAEVVLDNDGRVTSYKVLANPCDREGIFAKPLASPKMGTQAESNELIWQQLMPGGKSLELRANMMML